MPPPKEIRPLARSLPLTLLLLISGLAALTFSSTSIAAAPITGSAIDTTPVEAARLSDPAVIEAAMDPSAPDPVATPNTPTLPPVQASAKKSDVEVTNTTSYPNRVHGKIVVEFNNDAKQTYACSGTMVNSVQKNIVFTAGHCVYDNGTRAYPSAMVFIPGYNNGAKPFGEYIAYGVQSPVPWISREDFKYDIGAVLLDGTPEDRIGSRGIAFDLNPTNRKFGIFGYPADPEPFYDGERLIRCDARMKGRDGNTALAPMAAGPCFMRQGASGGGWITDGRFLNSITSYVYCEPGDPSPVACGLDFGPYFSAAAKSLYEAVADTVTPTIKFVKPPPRVTTKRRLVVKLGGTGTTPLTDFSCRLDRRRWTECFPSTVISSLTVKVHRLAVRSIDQTGRVSTRTAVKRFRVKKPIR